MTLRKCFGYHHIVHGNWSVHEMMRYLEAHSLNSTKNTFVYQMMFDLGQHREIVNPKKNKSINRDFPSSGTFE